MLIFLEDKNNEEQFKFQVKQVLGNVAQKLDDIEAYTFYEKYNQVKDSIGKIPQKDDLLEFVISLPWFEGLDFDFIYYCIYNFNNFYSLQPLIIQKIS